MYIYCIYLSIHPYINISMSVSVSLEITKLYSSLFVSAVCSTGDLWFYHKNAVIVPMSTLKFGSFTDIKSVVLF